MVRLFFVFVLTAVLCGRVAASADSVVLESITIRALPWQDYAAGLKITAISHGIGFQQSLASALLASPQVYIKAYGAGQLATLTIRGTSSSQNALFWHGINANITSLGQTDFSLTPLALVDKAELQLGASSSLLGSEAIGGSVHVSSSIPNESALCITSGLGSFGSHHARIAATAVSGNFAISSKVFRQSARNNFTYINTSKRGHPRETMQHAGFTQFGFSQDVWWQPKANHQLGLHLWYTHMERNIQPTLSATNRDHQMDQTLRVMLAYVLDSKWGATEIKLARLEDRIYFNGDLSIMPREYGSVEQEIAHGKVTHRFGANFQQFRAKIEAYNGEIAEKRADIYYSSKFIPANRWVINGAIRQTFAKGFSPPVTPSLGWEHAIGAKFIWSGNISRSYRVPTLNDRYWQPGGNIDLKPEHGLHSETSLNFVSQEKLKSSITLYGGKVSNWIIWLPRESYWAPENIDKVALSGIEYDVEWNALNHFTVALHYALTKSVREQSFNTRFIGKQLPYVPLHQVNANIIYNKPKYNAQLGARWTGMRYTTADNGENLPAYLLVDLSILVPVRARWQFAASIHNITNQDYQLVDNRAMPGINFNLTVQHTFQFDKR